MVAVSKAPSPVLEDFKNRMGWTFKWISSIDNDFNRDYHVSFTQEEIDSGRAHYNYRPGGFPSTEAPGASVFYKDSNGDIFHTYSVYQRGLDMFITAYHYLESCRRDATRTISPSQWSGCTSTTLTTTNRNFACE